MHRLPFAQALFAFRMVSFVLAVAAMLWLCRQLQLSVRNAALVMIITLTYGPFYSVLAGGNLDALMLALLIGACARKPLTRAVFLGLSIATKVYSLLLMPILALRRRWRLALCALGFVVLLLLPFARYAPEGLSGLLHRGTQFRLLGNQSPAVLFILIFGVKHVWVWRTCYALLWGGTLLVRLAADKYRATHDDAERFLLLDYLPWMAAAPVLVFYYTSTILLPLVALLAQRNQQRRLHWGEWMMAAGFLLTAIYPWVFWHVLPGGSAANQVDSISTLLAPVGLSMMLLGSSAAAWARPWPKAQQP